MVSTASLTSEAFYVHINLQQNALEKFTCHSTRDTFYRSAGLRGRPRGRRVVLQTEASCCCLLPFRTAERAAAPHGPT